MPQLRPWRRLRTLLYAGLQDQTRERMKTTAMVFAPHQDDETLGCGGTIILKRQAGTPVTCVFMMDGSSSHSQFMDAGELRILRKGEAIEAAEILGLNHEDVHFLDIPDGQLRQHRDYATTKVIQLLERYQPEEVYVPYHADGLPDHEGTYEIVIEALGKVKMSVKIFEYPIWYWNQWPWVPFHFQFNRDTGKAILKTLRAGAGWRLIKECRTGVFIANILEKKRNALDRYYSQMKVLRPGTTWPTLHDVSGGGFLQCFFQKYEIFQYWDYSSEVGDPSKP